MADNLEKRLARAVEDITPDVLDRILLELDEREKSGAEPRPDNLIDISAAGRKTSSTVWKRWMVSVAAMLVLVIGTYFTYGRFAVDSVIGFDVNPSIQLTINRGEKVLSAIPLNEDAEIILGDMQLRGTDLNIAVNALIGSMLKNGYVTEIANSILISVENNDAGRAAELRQRLSGEVSSLLSAYSFGGSVISQSYTGRNADIEARAAEHGISYSKAELVYKLVTLDPTLLFSDIAVLPVNDIKLLIEAREAGLDNTTSEGEASSAAYIGIERACELAFSHAGLEPNQVTLTEAKLDFEDGRMIYEIEFYSGGGEYEYEIDAVTGGILSFDMDRIKDSHATGGSDSKGGNSGETAPPPSSPAYISLSDAREAALSHAGLSAAEVTFTKEKLDNDDDRVIYDIEFYSGGYEYDYEIDAVTGAVLDFDKEYDDDYDDRTPSAAQPPAASENADNREDDDKDSGLSASYIGADSAKSIALGHAGLSVSQVRSLKAELDEDDGRMIYEVEFKNGDTKYEYELDATTGEILKSEIDD